MNLIWGEKITKQFVGNIILTIMSKNKENRSQIEMTISYKFECTYKKWSDKKMTKILRKMYKYV